MNLEIHTAGIEPLRKTFANLERRFGDKPASRYQEGTYDAPPGTNFHYFPTWDPDRELYDARRTAIVMQDWYAFADPRQYYYGAYVIARSRQQEAAEKNFSFVEKRALLDNLDAPDRDLLISGLLPLRHYEWGANMNNNYVVSTCMGTALAQPALFCAMDRVAVAQYLSRIGLLLDGNTGATLDQAKAAWLADEDWQPLRRTLEDTFVVQDWFENLITQNLVADGLLYPLVYEQFERSFTGRVGAVFTMLNEFMIDWYAEHTKWIDSVVKIAAKQSDENAGQIRQWIATWRPRWSEALQPLARQLLGDDAQAGLDASADLLDKRLAKAGL